MGANATMELVADMVRHVSKLDVSVLITGETGTGKEIVARAIHDASRRRDARFGDVNCGTITEALFESNVFGHIRGAFTGAVSDHAGLVEVCDGGTLFLDEIGELSPTNQVRLLRVLQTRTFNRLGDTTPRTSDFRLVSATNRDLRSMVADGAFRDDLFYRINVFPIHLPPLRDRIHDLPQLVQEILRDRAEHLNPDGQIPAITEAAIDRLRTHHWPGNIRELENIVTRAAIMAGGEPIDTCDIPLLGVPLPRRRSSGSGRMRTLAEAERDHIVRVLSSVDGNITAAADILKISRTTLYKKLRDHAIDCPGQRKNGNGH